jgi:drug/metabolite transporter (DMT)-like permease
MPRRKTHMTIKLPFKKKLKLRRDIFKTIIGLIIFSIAILGFIGLSYYGNNISLSGTFFGVILVLISSIFMASYGLAVKKYFNETNAIVSFSIIAVYTAIGIVILMFIFGEPNKITEIPVNILFLIALSAFIGINMAHVLFYIALKHIGVTISSSVSLFTAFFTAILSYLIFDEKLTFFHWLTGTLIIIGGLLTILAKNRKESLLDK